MGINSREEILKQMAGQSVTFGWGAVTVFNKTRLNRLLEQQYVSRMEGNSFFPGFAGEISLSSSSNATVKLDSVVLGKPLLSFEQAASLDESMATVTLNIVSGNLLLMQPGEKSCTCEYQFENSRVAWLSSDHAPRTLDDFGWCIGVGRCNDGLVQRCRLQL